MKNIVYVLLIIILTGCATPKRSVRIEDRLWLENDYYKKLENFIVEYRIDRVLTRYGHTQTLVAGKNNEKTIVFYTRWD